MTHLNYKYDMWKGRHRPGVSNSFEGADHTARYHSVGGPHCF